MKPELLERKIAFISLGIALFHFTVETIWHFQHGQFLPMLIVDYIAISLMVFAAVRSLQTANASGLLCGAWGFLFCLNYRALFLRVHDYISGNINSEVLEMYFLSFLLLITGSVFSVTLYLANPKTTNRK